MITSMAWQKFSSCYLIVQFGKYSTIPVAITVEYISLCIPMWSSNQKPPFTMVTQDADNEPFIIVTRTKPHKKAHSTLPPSSGANPEIKIELCIIFELPHQPHTTFNPAHHVKQLITKWLCHDNTPAIKSLMTEDEIIYLVHKQFPIKESEFVKFFEVHSILNCSQQNLVTIGCHVHTTKTVLELKKSILEECTMMDWLNTNHVYMEADMLGHSTIRMI